jgi:hypothetical protein
MVVVAKVVSTQPLGNLLQAMVAVAVAVVVIMV